MVFIGEGQRNRKKREEIIQEIFKKIIPSDIHASPEKTNDHLNYGKMNKNNRCTLRYLIMEF